MRILLSNDDGYFAPGILSLAESLAPLGAVTIVAPERDRIAYVSEVERLTWPEAEKVVRERERTRQRFVAGKFGRPVDDVMQYDLVLNVARPPLRTAHCPTCGHELTRGTVTLQLARGSEPATAVLCESCGYVQATITGAAPVVST